MGSLLKYTLWSVFLLCVSYASAQEKTPNKLAYLENGNQIPLFENRFRIDHDIDKITLLFFRQEGSPAVILIRPDGSKLYAPNAYDDEQLQWHDETNYDLIVINNPMKGPWQVVGQILPKSRIMVLGDIRLEVPALPPLLFQGEIIRITGKVLNDGEQIKAGHFDDVISLYVDFVSTNNEAFSNFGAPKVRVAEFKDDGTGFDERPNDAIFTGEFNLNFQPGQWRPEIALNTPIIERKVEQDPVEIKALPLTFDFHQGDDSADHQLTITLDTSVLNASSVLVQGKIFYPNNDEQAFSLSAIDDAKRTLSIKNAGPGRYSVQIDMFGSNVNGREFMATVGEQVFSVAAPSVQTPVAPNTSLEESEQEQVQPTDEPSAIPERAEPMSKNMFNILVLISNVLLLVLGAIFIRVVILKKPLFGTSKRSPLGKKQTEETTKQNQQNKVNSDEKGSKSDKSGEILNLSMSDD